MTRALGWLFYWTGAVSWALRHHGPDCAPVTVRGERRCACEFGRMVA